MMRVLVTGGQGRLGRAVASALLARGDRVVSVDRHLGVETPNDGETRRRLDVRDVGALLGVMAGSDAVIHCAAIPSPERHPAEVIFETNAVGTFAVLQAAMLAGVSRAVVASSLSALGGAWANPPHPPRYVPVDEAHPLEMEDPYGLSKVVNERTAEMFHRRAGMSVAALRFGWIISAGEARAEAALFAADPMRNQPGLWSYIDERDAARACLDAIDAPPFGYAALTIIGFDTLATIPTDEALARYAPAVVRRASFEGFQSPFSGDLARRVIRFAARHSWRG